MMLIQWQGIYPMVLVGYLTQIKDSCGEQNTQRKKGAGVASECRQAKQQGTVFVM
jgi:hypothetical protein